MAELTMDKLPEAQPVMPTPETAKEPEPDWMEP